MALDFKKLTLQDALDLAILVEQEARERYEEFAYQMSTHATPAAADFFRLMMTYEAKHATQLAARREALFGSAAVRVNRNDLWDVEAPEYDEARAFMSAKSAMAVALEAERKAFRFFDDALHSITDANVRALFEELREDERHHEALVIEAISKQPDDAAGAQFEGDEPVAQ